MKIYTVYDRVTSEYSAPISFINDEDAMRRLYQAYVNNPFRDDLEIYFIGEFDSEVGRIVLFGDDKQYFMSVSQIIAEVSSNAQA